MLRKIGAVAAIAAMIVSGAPAKAATYDFTFTGGANDQGVTASRHGRIEFRQCVSNR